MTRPSRSLTDFTGHPRHMDVYDGTPLGERLHIGVVSGVVAVAAFMKEKTHQAIELGRDIAGAVMEELADPPKEG